MILADTSRWIGHFRTADPALAAALTEGQVGLHPFVMGELTLGGLPRRAHTLTQLAALPSLESSSHEDVLAFIDRHDLVGSGIGWVDAHLLCAAQQAGWDLWTHDRPLLAAVKRVASPRGR